MITGSDDRSGNHSRDDSSGDRNSGNNRPWTIIILILILLLLITITVVNHNIKILQYVLISCRRGPQGVIIAVTMAAMIMAEPGSLVRGQRFSS